MAFNSDNIKHNPFKEITNSQNIEKEVKDKLGNNNEFRNFFKANKIVETKSLLDQKVSDLVKENNGKLGDEFDIDKIKDDLFEQYDNEQQ